MGPKLHPRPRRSPAFCRHPRDGVPPAGASRTISRQGDLGAAITRLATLAPGGRVRVEDVERELIRLRRAWSPTATSATSAGDRLGRELLGDDAWDELDRFDQVQLAEVLRVVQASPSLAAAGRVLFAQSRARRGSPNDSDRLRKYLAGFGLNGAELLRRLSAGPETRGRSPS